MSADIAVVGAGPAGMAAAVQAHQLGLSVTLLDDNPRPGGQIYRDLETSKPGGPHDKTEGRTLIRALRESGIDYVPDTRVWEIAAHRHVGIVNAGRASLLPVKQVLIAEGAMERPVPVPGWTLPGVMGVGGAQVLLKTAGLHARDAVFAGSGPLLLLVVYQYLRSGARIQAVLDTTPAANWLHAMVKMPLVLSAPGELAEGLRWIRAIRGARVPVYRNVEAVHALGANQLEAVEFQAGGRTRRLPAAHLFLHQGVIPRVHLGMASGCRYSWDAERLYWRPVVDAFGQSSVAAIGFAGDTVEIQGAQAAATHGAIAALGAAARLGTIDTRERDARTAPLQRRLRHQRRLRPWLDTLYRPRAGLRLPADDSVLVCRCEEVTAAEIKQAAALGCSDPNQVKALTRCGMGPCQGRQCAAVLSEMLASANATTVEHTGYLRLRAPVVPLRIGELAALTTAQPDD